MKNLTVILGRTLVATMFVVATPAWGQQPQAPQPPQPPQTPAQTFFAEGKEAAEAERWEKAAKLFAQSFQLEQIPKTAGWLGRALVESGDFVAGANYLEFFIREEKQPSKMKEAAQEMLASVKSKIATVTFDLNPPDAEAFVDGNRIEDKRLTWPFHVSPGEHSFEFKKAGYIPRAIRGKYAAGDPQVIQVKLDPVVEKNGNGQGATPGKASGLAPEAKVGFAVAGGLALVAVGTGIGAIATLGPAKDAYPPGGRCYLATDPECGREYENLSGTVEGLTWTATISSGLALGAFIFAVTRPRTGQPSTGSAKVGLMVVPTVGGMAISGVW